MGIFLAVFGSYILVCNECQIFRNTVENIEGPIWSLYIFLTAVFLLLYDLRLYPKTLRKLDALSQTIVEFLVAMFSMEIILLDFWFPLETGAKALCLQGAEKIEQFTDYDENYSYITESLKSPSAQTAVSYVMSIFFLLAVLHAIRAVDFRALQDGPGCFFGDIAYRVKRFINKKLRAFGFGKRRVKIKCEELVKPRSLRQKIPKDKKNNSPCPSSCPVDLDDINNLSKYEELNLDCDDSLDEDSLKFNEFDIPDDSDLLLSDD